MRRIGKLRAHLFASLVLIVAPLMVLGPCLVGNRTYVPYDLAMFSPRAVTLTEAEYSDVVQETNLDPTEVPVMFLPQLRFLRDHAMEGRLPHWDPYARSGTTLWASSVLGITYPPNWLLLFYGDPADGLALVAWLGFCLGGILMYGFLTQIGLRPVPALFGALVFQLCGTMAVNAHFYQRMHTLIWLPGMLWSILRIGRNQGAKRYPGMISLALCVFASLTAGFPPYALTNLTIAGAYSLWLGGISWRRGGAGAAWRLLALTGAAVVLGVGAAGVQIGPALGFFPESNRTPGGGPSLFQVFDLYGLLGYLSPELISHPHLQAGGALPYSQTPIGWLLQNRTDEAGNYFLSLNYNFIEYTVFVGTLTLFLAFAGIFTKGPRFRIFAALMFVALLILACGGKFLGPILAIPPAKWVPPMRFMGPACMLLAALAAMGLENLGALRQRLHLSLGLGGLAIGVLALFFWLWAEQQSPESFRENLTPALIRKYEPQGVTAAQVREQLDDRILARGLEQLQKGSLRTTILLSLSGIFFLLLPMLHRRRPGIVRLAVMMFIIGELLVFAIPINHGRDLQFSTDTPIHDFLRKQRDKHFKVGGFAVIRGHHGDTDQPSPPPLQLPGGTLLNERIRDLHAYTFVDGRSHLPFVALYGPEQMASGFWPLAFPDDDRLSRPYLDLLGVRFVLSETPMQHAGKRVGPEWRGDRGEFFVYERANPLPRAFVVHRHRDVGVRDEEIARALVAKDFAPRTEVLLDSTTITLLAAAHKLVPSDKPPPETPRKVTFVPHENPDVLELRVSSGAAGYLVLNDTFMSGWTVEVDGKAVPHYRCNLFQRVLPLGERGATVRFLYSAPGYRTGLIVTIVSMLLLAFLGLSLATSRHSGTQAEQAL